MKYQLRDWTTRLRFGHILIWFWRAGIMEAWIISWHFMSQAMETIGAPAIPLDKS